jgi:hypothetical protein
MTKKDFVAIMTAVKDARGALPENSATGRVIDSMAKSIADVLARQSGKFDRKRFLIGCGNQGP